MFSKKCLPTLVLTFIWTSLSHNAFAYKVETESHAVSYLTTYGYVDPEVMPRHFTLKDCNKKLKEFQKLSRVPVTGKLDEATLKAMNTPRCGCPDFIKVNVRDNSRFYPKDEGNFNKTEHDHGNGNQNPYHRHHQHHHHHHNRSTRRYRRYAVSELRWETNEVTYKIAKFPSRHGLQVSEREVEDAIHKAFNIWEEHINLKFSHEPNSIEVDIEIRFESGYHNDNYPFDGPGKTLAHAFFPGRGIGGDVHFEEEENWTVGVYNGVDVLYVALHEIGHSIGIGHSSNFGAIMYPMYRGYVPNLQLHSDDILGAQALYGVKQKNPFTTPPPPTLPTRRTTKQTTTTKRSWPDATTTTPTPNPYNDLCTAKRVDAIATIFNDGIFVFKGANVYELGKNGEGVLPGWPKDIRSYFRGVEENLDCVVTRSNGKTYFFKGGIYWRFTGKQMDRGYPRTISQHFPGIPDNLDAVFEWDEEFVFTKGNQFWRFNTRRRPQVESYFPMPLSHWGLSKKLDAAFTTTNGTAYLFQDLYYWKFDKDNHRVHSDSYWPASAMEDWYGCGEP